MRTPDVFKIKHIVKYLDDNRQKMQSAFKKDILNVYAEGGEDGSVPPKSGGDSMRLGLPFNALVGKEEAAKAALDDFGAREFSIPQTKLTGKLLLSVSEWSAAELTALAPILVDLVVEEAPEEAATS